MYGLICKSLEGFVRDRRGAEAWGRIVARAELPFETFEALRVHDKEMMLRLIAAAAQEMQRETLALIEDVGHWICTHPPLEPVRRLIRFSGRNYVDLIHSFDEMQERAKLALPGIDFPEFLVTEVGPGRFEVVARWEMAGAAALLTGMFRAMADDYGALALIETTDFRREDGLSIEVISIHVIEQAFQEPKEFKLGLGV
ncbi:heme NO-binding domain-containing protein [Jannaschia rubra]|uniref:Heme NO binding protein n=1 Tax=Jannaschia rubra TaxID=282197 RepID=A0A0M6XRQ7_9RHOB|nr:heme NO-binding domain-containing protein [Jannaschia rubra]CTQ32835.1 Heme NO binding protein [Jannaschia rubra]SFG81500.1 Haem-NO-binding [Jannaschia rubra]